MDDRLNAGTVEVQVDQFGKVWVNIDGKCAMRIGRAKLVTVDDPLRGHAVVHQSEKYKMVDGVQVFESYADYCSS